ncbi:MAG: MATE family efflux transporter [Lachnospiraceae bacterium]|nr:MATE family efflux transporter [Lachnospiraceae bacterium]MDD3616611.1 MATE family efflux transporter [Lachnospiraceae bacterium]
MRLREKYIGDGAFYKKVLLVAVPIMIQNGITNFVSLLDNIMVGHIGTEQMSGVAIVNQLLMVYYLCIFGGLSGAGIFTAQYYGQGDDEGIRHTFRYKFWMGVILTVGVVVLFLGWGNDFIQLFLNGGNDGGDLQATLGYGNGYLRIMLLGLPPFLFLQIYASTLRECGETVVPMKAGICAVFVNLVFNYFLIYGKFGFPQLGVTGAAIATVLSRYVEAAIVVWWTHSHKSRNTYIEGIYRTLKVPLKLVKNYFIKGAPLLVNETLWSAGMAFLLQCYSVRGLNVVAGINIANTINNVFNVVFIAMGDAVAIIIGQLLGAGRMKEAKDTDTKIIAFSVFSSAVMAVLMFAAASMFPNLYNTTPEAKLLAAQFIMAQAVFMPQNAFMHATYFTIRSGGKTLVTFFFDSVFVWCVSVPVAYFLSRYTQLYVLVIFCLGQMADWIKCAIGYILVKKGVWMQNIVKD